MICERIEGLRREMRFRGISVYVIPSSDPHESEYVCAHYQARAFMTGFTGSAGTAVITLEDAGLWTDGRYFVQADGQLSGTGVTLFRDGEPGVPTVEEYVKAYLSGGETMTFDIQKPPCGKKPGFDGRTMGAEEAAVFGVQRAPHGNKLGFDGRTMSAEKAEKLKRLAEETGAGISMEEDLVGLIWRDRPQIPDGTVWILEERWSGETVEKKLERVRREMKKAGADRYVLASLCDIAWLLNLRGNDIPHVPVTLSFLAVGEENCVWYVRPSVLTGEVRDYLEKNNIEFRDYEQIYADLRQQKNRTILMDKKSVNAQLWNCIPKDVKKIDKPNPTERMKAVKNPVEQKNLRLAHKKESLAFTRFMYWLKTKAVKEGATELQAGEYLDGLRKEQENYLEQSFEPICAYGANGAIVHYSATEESNTVIRPEGFLLVDAGGHYLEGTTDSTRTFAMGPLTYEQKRMYTAVLRGNLRLANARFLEGCSGLNLDILCREPLWRLGLDYRHGTGHGVGHILNVHEGPNAFRWKFQPGVAPAALAPGMVTTDEPGVYLKGRYGIRLENELLCVEDEKTEYGQFLRFDMLTFIPFDLDAVLPEEMTAEERELLNSYHRRVYEVLEADLSEEERAWLRGATRAV